MIKNKFGKGIVRVSKLKFNFNRLCRVAAKFNYLKYITSMCDVWYSPNSLDIQAMQAEMAKLKAEQS